MKKSEMLPHVKGILLGTAVTCSVVSAVAMPENRVRPNILLILADDLGYGDLSCQGATDLKSPNIDRIFKEGIRFSNIYANSTVCSPSRSALLSGCYPDLAGVPGVIRTQETDSWGYLSKDVSLLPVVLKKLHYTNAIVGKWHLGLEAPNLPNQRGFDEFYGFLGDMMEDYYTHIRDNSNYMRINEKVVSPQGHATDIFTNWALDFLKKQEKKKDPFFLYLAYNAPHAPIQPPPEWIGKVLKRERNISDKRAKLVALIEHLDDNIGRILNQLENSGQLDNTVILFVSDNGGDSRYAAGNGPYRGGKGDLYDGGIRIPGGIMWKNVIQPGRVSDNLVLLMDLFPTICEIAGGKPQHGIDGMSILPILLGKTLVTDDRTVFFMRREGGMLYGGQVYYAARNRQLKILQNTPWEEMQYFDLSQDPYEANALTKTGNSDYQKLFQQLTRHIGLTGAVPWKSPAQAARLKSGTSGKY
jgi:arylsulfatase A-like enzyme